MSFRQPLSSAFAIAALAGGASHAAAQQKPIPTTADYAKFETLGGDALSPDGHWYAWRISRPEADGELHLRRADQDDAGQTIPFGLTPTFSRDSRAMAYAVEVSVKERERLTREKKPITQSVALVVLATNKRTTWDAVRAFAFSPDARFLALQGYAPTEIRGKGAPLRVVEVATGREVSFGDVGEYRWSDDGGILAMTVATGTPTGNGLQLYAPASGQLRSLESAPSTFHGLVWRKGNPDLAVFRSVAPAGTDRPGEAIIVWRGLDGAGTRMAIDSTTITGAAFPYDLVDFNGLRWSTDGTMIAFGMRPREPRDSTPPRGPGSAADSAATVQIWHPDDVALFPAQQLRTSGETRRTLLALIDVNTGRLRKVGTDLAIASSLLEGWKYAVERPANDYNWGTMFGRRYHDLWLVSTVDGKRTEVFKKARYSYESPDGRYLMTFDGKDYWTYEVATGKKVNITAGVKTSFVDTEYDTPTDLNPPEGMAGWLPGDQGVILYDQFDAWRVAADGSGSQKLTDGRADGVVYRLTRLSNDVPGIDLSKPQYFTLTGDRDVKSGFAMRSPDGQMKRLVYGDKAYRALRKADSATVYLYRGEDRDDSPDVFTAGADFASPRQLTATNTFLKDVAWTRSELVSYKSEAGMPLKGILLYPANYDASKKYPMIVYTYERLSQDLHTFVAPSERSYYNQTVWTLNGYFVLMPDIIFTPREPGISTIQSVRPAVKAVAARGLIDPKRVGHVGHSWGGYEAAFLGTNGGDFLATTIAGASITDLVSFMGQIHWSGGSAELDHFENGQARMQVPYWEDPAAHKRNSPIENVQNMKIPMLMAHGNKDGTVEFFQATEFWNFARRAGKDVVLLVYDGEDHGFSRKANQIDYQRRILEWFGHYLKGEPAPKWITEGIKAGDLTAEVKRVADKKDGPK